jgi:hypothetical protein
VLALAAEPAEEDAQEHREVEPVGLGPPVLARDRNAGRMNDVGLDAALAQPACQPEPVAAGFKGQHDARDRPPHPQRFIAPTLEQLEERRGIRLELLLRLTLKAGDNRTDEPTRPAQLDRRDERGVLLK